MAFTPPDRLESAWTASLAPYRAPPAAIAGALDRLRGRHQEPHRRYHDLEHLDEVLRAVETLSDLADDVSLVSLAACFHDAVYDPRSTTNELDSARLAIDELTRLGVAPRQVAAVAELVRATTTHELSQDTNVAVLNDADLWILGSPPDRYHRYVADVRAEYAHVDDDAWRAGRTAVLDEFLARSRIYATDRFHTSLDASARQNLADERRSLVP